MTNVPLDFLLVVYKDGEGHGWEREREWIEENHPETLLNLEESIIEHGIQTPVEIGDDGRVWDGHHRIVVAMRLGLEYVPVKFIWMDKY